MSQSAVHQMWVVVVVVRGLIFPRRLALQPRVRRRRHRRAVRPLLGAEALRFGDSGRSRSSKSFERYLKENRDKGQIMRMILTSELCAGAC